MIRLTSAKQALSLRGTIPELAVLRMVQFEGSDGAYDPASHGYIVIIEEGDDIALVPEVGPGGLFDVIDDEWRSYDALDAFDEDGHTVFEMVISLDNERTLAVIIPDAPWLDSRLRLVLDVETEGRVSAFPKGALQQC